jgi:anti-anti-sigma factor
MMQRVEKREVDSITVVKIWGELEVGSLEEFRKHMDEIISEKKLNLVLDLEESPFIDSSFLGELVKYYNSLTKQAGHLYLAALSENVKKIFELTRLDKILNTFDNVDKAVEDLKGKIE